MTPLFRRPAGFPRRFLSLLIGLLFYGLGISLMVRAGLGVAPWDVLALGVENQTGWNFGFITVGISLVVLLLWIPLRQWPGIGTVLNTLLVGPSANLGFAVFPETDNLIVRGIYLVTGILTIGLATGLYIGSHFGPGPRDGLMTGLVRRTGWKIWQVRSSIEIVVLAIGWALGGNVGIGTVLFAFGIGPICNLTIPWLALPRKAHDAQLESELEGSLEPSTPEHAPGDSPAN
ncbi:MAG TPA: hypothetical protein VK139_03505 [Microbacteriaceae bacterium]|nr:hypothetical protein [Microbacteriaceae bacterium]